jgi:hypothetical protein
MLSASAATTSTVIIDTHGHHRHNANSVCSCARLLNALAGIDVIALLSKYLQDISLSKNVFAHSSVKSAKRRKEVFVNTNFEENVIFLDGIDDEMRLPNKHREDSVRQFTRNISQSCICALKAIANLSTSKISKGNVLAAYTISSCGSNRSQTRLAL